MALAEGDVSFWRQLRDLGVLPENPAVLEIGEANWYGDVSATGVPEVAAGGGEGEGELGPFATAKSFYRGVLGPGTTFAAIDGNGTDAALRLDLNRPQPGLSDFDIVINSGTAEHVFDQRQLFQTVHDAAAVGGLMIHAAPVSGWPDHGFYNYHPGLFRDLATANGYEPILEVFWQCRGGRAITGGWRRVMPEADLTLYVALRKGSDAPFRVPTQAKYRGNG